MLKKMMLLAMSVGALVAFAVPATASATDVWTDWNSSTEKHETLGAGKTAPQAFEGVLKFTTPAPPLPVESSFECKVTVKIFAEGPSGGKISKFAPTTTECAGTGVLAGCVLKEDFSSLVAPTHFIKEEEEEIEVLTSSNWNINIAATPGTVSQSEGNLTIRNVYENCPNAAESHLEFESIAVAPTLNAEGTITKLTISGTATNKVTKASGSITPEGALTLGIESTP